MTNVIEQLKIALAEEFEVEVDEMLPDAGYVDVLGLDSLDFVDVVVLIEKITGVKLSRADFKELRTFSDLFKAIEERRQ